MLLSGCKKHSSPAVVQPELCWGISASNSLRYQRLVDIVIEHPRLAAVTPAQLLRLTLQEQAVKHPAPPSAFSAEEMPGSPATLTIIREPYESTRLMEEPSPAAALTIVLGL